MAQKQFTTYQADILSFELREALLGIAKPGRYQGWASMAANGTPSGGLIPVRISHANFKKATHAVPPVLGSAIGVAISTQGTIIHDDQPVDKSIAVGTSSIRWDILYMEHVYLDILGANNATFDIQQGVAGSGVPTLLNPEKRIIIGLIKVGINATSVSGLTYYPKQSTDMFGDTDLIQKLWGTSAEHILDGLGSIPAAGAIGTRSYTQQNYVTNAQSLTDSINALDVGLKQTANSIPSLSQIQTDISVLQQKRIDQWAVGADTTDCDVTIQHHGLVPKLPSSLATVKFFRGDGQYVQPDWSGITGKPTTIAGYGITDAYTISTIQELLGSKQNTIQSVPYIDFNLSRDSDQVGGRCNVLAGSAIQWGKFVVITGYFVLVSAGASGEMLFKIPPGISVPAQAMYFSCTGTSGSNSGTLLMTPADPYIRMQTGIKSATQYHFTIAYMAL